MLLKPTPDMPTAPPRGVARHPERARFIQCDVCRQRGEDKWRRVDAETLAATSTRIWKLDDLDKVGQQILIEQPQVQDKLRTYISELLFRLKRQVGSVRATSHVTLEHYSAFVRSCFEDLPSDPLRRLSLVDTFVAEVYAQDDTCLLHDSLLRGMDEASNVFSQIQHEIEAAAGLVATTGSIRSSSVQRYSWILKRWLLERAVLS